MRSSTSRVDVAWARRDSYKSFEFITHPHINPSEESKVQNRSSPGFYPQSGIAGTALDWDSFESENVWAFWERAQDINKALCAIRELKPQLVALMILGFCQVYHLFKNFTHLILWLIISVAISLSVVDKVVNPTLDDLVRISFNKFLKYLLLSPIKKLSPSTILVRIPMISTFWIRISNLLSLPW